VLRSDSFDWFGNTIDLDCEGYWTGDRICLFSEGGLPIAGNGFPGSIDGVAMYAGGQWFLGPNRDHIENDADTFYKAATEDYPDGDFGDDANFYYIGGDTNGDGEINGLDEITNRCYYIHVDDLGRVSFYTDRCAALLGDPDDRVDLINVDFDFILIAPFGSMDYLNAVWACAPLVGEYLASDVQENNVVPIDSICDHPPLYQLPAQTDPPTDFNNADIQPRRQGVEPYWEIICGVREWTLELDAPSVDTTAVGDKYGESVKSLVSGGGSVEFFIDKCCVREGQDDAMELMQLLFMTEKGSKANAQFYMIDRSEQDPDVGICGCLPGDLYYQSEIYIVKTAVNLRPTELVAGTASFVTTGPIKLLSEPP
jgi:hypothetical protein